MKKFPYRMSYLYIGPLLVVTGFIFYGVWFDRGELGFASTTSAKLIASVFIGIPFVVFLRPPSLRHILLFDDKVVIPRLFNPFLNKSTVYFGDILRVYRQDKTEILGLRAINIVTRHGKYKIYPEFLRDIGEIDKFDIESAILRTLIYKSKNA